MRITELLKGTLPPAVATSSTLASTAVQPQPPLHDPSVLDVVVATVAGSTAERATEVAELVRATLLLRQRQAEAGRTSAARKAAAHAARIDAAIVLVLGPSGGPVNTLPRTAAVLQRRLRAIGWAKFGIRDEPSLRALRDGISRYMAGTVASEPITDASAIPSTVSEAQHGASPSTRCSP